MEPEKVPISGSQPLMETDMIPAAVTEETVNSAPSDPLEWSVMPDWDWPELEFSHHSVP
jgi:hypothetical protein